MPVNFSQPEGGGAGSEMILCAINKSADRRLHAQQLAQQQAQHCDQMAMESARMRQQAYQFEQGRQPSARDNWEAQAHVQQALAINQGQLTQGENMRLQRLQAGRSSIQTALSQGQITREQAQEMDFQAQGLMTPLQARQAQTQYQMGQLQIEHQQQQNEIQQVTIRRNREVQNGGINSQLQPIYDQGMLAQAQADHRLRDPRASDQVILGRAQAQLHQQDRDGRGGIIGMGIMNHAGDVQFIPRNQGRGVSDPPQAAGAGTGTGAARPGAQPDGSHVVPEATRHQIIEEVVNGTRGATGWTPSPHRFQPEAYNVTVPGPNSTAEQNTAYRAAQALHDTNVIQPEIRRLLGLHGEAPPPVQAPLQPAYDQNYHGPNQPNFNAMSERQVTELNALNGYHANIEAAFPEGSPQRRHYMDMLRDARYLHSRGDSGTITERSQRAQTLSFFISQLRGVPSRTRESPQTTPSQTPAQRQEGLRQRNPSASIPDILRRWGILPE